MKNYFITFEGIDGSGKDTQLFRISEAIKDDDNGFIGNKYANVWLTREPTKITESGKLISDLIRKGNVSPEKSSSLFIKDRIEHSETIRNILKHSHVLCSRFDMSTFAYQGSQGEDLQKLYEMHKFHEEKGSITPDITLIIDVPAEIAYKRISNRKEKIECYETLEFLKEAEIWYKKVAEFLRERGRNIIIINGNQDVEFVTKEIINKIKELIN